MTVQKATSKATSKMISLVKQVPAKNRINAMLAAEKSWNDTLETSELCGYSDQEIMAIAEASAIDTISRYLPTSYKYRGRH